MLLEGGGRSQDGGAQVVAEPDGVSRHGGKIGEQGTEAMDRVAIVGALDGRLATACPRDRPSTVMDLDRSPSDGPVRRRVAIG